MTNSASTRAPSSEPQDGDNGLSQTRSSPVGARPGVATLLWHNRLAAAGLIILATIVLFALAAPALPLPDPNVTAPAQRLLRPFAAGHLLGTDALGRDIAARLVWGMRTSLAVGIIATLIAALIGSAIGLIAGYAGGRSDSVLMRGIDMVMAFPYILLALAIVAVLGPGLLNALIAIAIVNIPFFARNVRGTTLGLARREFVDAARLAGKGGVRILFEEVLPNVLPIIVITMSTTIGWMILETAGLSFLGLGAQPPQADLGSMLGDGRKLLFSAPHVSVVPGVMIFVVVMSINLVGDGIRDALDPRLKAGALTRPSARTAIRIDPYAAPIPGKTDALLAMQGLRCEFQGNGRRLVAVDGVDLSIRAGECLGIVGESGSGKSVTAMSVMGLVPSPPGVITAGRVELRGENVLTVDDRRLRSLRGAAVAYVFQDPLATLHPMLTIGDQLIEGIRAHRPVSRTDARTEAVALLDRVRLPNAGQRLHAYPHELSGGMRQRVCIAMALCHAPAVLIADEPTTALDVTVQAQVLRLFDALRADHDAAVMFITHDFGVVSAICDRIAVMYAGRIVETGATNDLLAAPAHPYTARLIECVPVLGQSQRLANGIDGQPPPPDDMPPGCTFAPRCDHARPECRVAEPAMQDFSGTRAVRCLFPLQPATGR